MLKSRWGCYNQYTDRRKEPVCDHDWLEITYKHAAWYEDCAISQRMIASLSYSMCFIGFSCIPTPSLPWWHRVLLAVCSNHPVIRAVTTVSGTLPYPQIHPCLSHLCVHVTYNRMGAQLAGGFQWHLSFPLKLAAQEENGWRLLELVLHTDNDLNNDMFVGGGGLHLNCDYVFLLNKAQRKTVVEMKWPTEKSLKTENDLFCLQVGLFTASTFQTKPI